MHKTSTSTKAFSFLAGVGLGAVIPLLAVFIHEFLHIRLFAPGRSYMVYLVSIGLNLIAVRIALPRVSDEVVRGMVLSLFTAAVAIFVFYLPA